MTARPIGRAGAKAGLSDPAVLDGKAVAQQIKGTPGITGLSPLSVHSGEEVWHLNTSGCCRSNPVPTNRLITVDPSVVCGLGNLSQGATRQYRGKSSSRLRIAEPGLQAPSAFSILQSEISANDPVTTDPKGKASISRSRQHADSCLIKSDHGL